MTLLMAASLWLRPLAPPPTRTLLIAIAIVTACIYLAVNYLERRWMAAQKRGLGSPDAWRPADRVGRRGFKANGMVLLRDNVWEGTRLDHVTAEWPQAMRGYYFVWPGRHQVVSGGDDPATLDFVLYPDEIFIRRLHAASQRWVPEHPENEDEVRKLAEGGPWGHWKNALVDYLQMTAVVPQDRLRLPDSQTLLASVQALAGRVEAGDSFDTLLEEARALGASLIGVPMTFDMLNGLTRALMSRAARLANRHAYNDGLKVLDLGLAVLPDDPWLLETKANLLSDVGLPEEALRAVEAALIRDQVLKAEGLLRARSTKAQILAHLGRYREAAALVRNVLQDRPGDARALSVQDYIERHPLD